MTNVARRRHRRPVWEREVPHGRHRPQWVEKMEFAALRQRQPRYRTQLVSTAVRSKLQPRGPGVADGRGVAPDLDVKASLLRMASARTPKWWREFSLSAQRAARGSERSLNAPLR